MADRTEQEQMDHQPARGGHERVQQGHRYDRQ
jgi:hypothetical protein